MLRITVHATGKAQTIQLEGKLSGPWVEEFSCAWRSLVPLLRARKLQVDLRGVGFVDGKGRELLRKIYLETNATFLTGSPLTQHFADEAMRKASKDGEGGD